VGGHISIKVTASNATGATPAFSAEVGPVPPAAPLRRR
jgi:hypothetical protein